MKRSVWLLVACLTVSCVTARQVAIVADQSFAAAVFALDDTEYQACQTHVLTAAQCEALNGPIKQALIDVQAVTRAIKASPSGIPASLPALLKDLGDVQAEIARLGPVYPDIATKAAAANLRAIDLLTQLMGGK